MAILLYKQGIRELEKAVQLNIDPNGKKFMMVVFLNFIVPSRFSRCWIKCKNAKKFSYGTWPSACFAWVGFPQIFIRIHHRSFSEGLLHKENAAQLKAHAIPTKAQRPTPPQHIAAQPPVCIWLASCVLINNVCVFPVCFIYISLSCFITCYCFFFSSLLSIKSCST